MKELLQGKPLGNPLHPLLVHFPIALFLLTSLLDLVAILFDPGAVWIRAAFGSLALGIVLALIAAIPGFIDFLDIRRDHPARRIGTMHMVLNLVAVGINAISLGVRFAGLQAAEPSWLAFLLSICALAVVGYSGHLGGKMIYHEGIAVGRHRRHTRRPEKTLYPEKSDDDWFAVCLDSELPEGATMRVEIEDTIVVVARHDGQLYAFQEFCTHRFGPLSEGTLHDGQVECPWHRSCFNLRTGKVEKGPAKVDLKLYPVSLRGNAISVRRAPLTA